MKKKEVIYYKDPLNDDFAGTKIKADTIDENYNFVPKNFFYTLGTYILRGIAFPIIFIIEHLVCGITFKNKKALKNLKKAYLYGNHTGFYDAFTPMLLAFPNRNKIIVSPDAVSIKGLKTIVKMLGTIPLPTTARGMMKFSKEVEYCHQKGEYITIYPEAHIWPYYTGVRPFKDSSFNYPVKDGSPVVGFFTCFEKPKGLSKLFRKAKITVYISNPFYPDTSISPKQARLQLRNQVYDFMEQCSKNHSTYNVIQYIYQGDNDGCAQEKSVA